MEGPFIFQNEEEYLEDFITRGLREDVGQGDYTSLACIPEDATDKAKLLIKDPGGNCRNSGSQEDY